MGIQLVPLAQVTIGLRELITIGASPAGHRTIGELSSFDLVGDRLNAHLKGVAAADWLTVSADGVATVDVRVVVETNDSAVIYVNYQGRFDQHAGRDAVLYVAPRFETSDERYRWLNTLQAVGKGQFAEPGVRYEWYELR